MHRPSLIRLLILTLAVAGFSNPGVSALADDTHAFWHPTPGLTWQIQFSAPLAGDPLPVQVYDLDGFETDAETVDRLHTAGIRVLCYMSMGTWEDWRSDAADFPAEVIGNAWDEWPGERFLDIRRIDLLAPILLARLDLCAAKGFDAVEPDNIDTYGNPEEVTGFPLTQSDQLAFNRWLASVAHERGLAIGQKNVPELTGELVDLYDFAVTEDCLADGWCDQVAPYLDADKPVFAIEYTDRTSENAFQAACATQAAPFSFILKHRNLDAWRLSCP